MKEQLANNYLLGMDQYPDTLEKASRILGNYQVAKGSPFGDQRITNKKGGLAFIQLGARAGRGCRGQGPQTAGRQAGAGDTAAGREDAASVGRSTQPSERVRTNNAGDSHCYHCGGEDHWANKCPELAEEQQAQLHTTLEGSKEDELGAQTAHQFFHASMVQEEELPDCRAYLDGCLMVTAFKNKKHLSNIRTVACGIKINYNARNLKTNQQGDYGTMSVWYIPEGIANIFSMNELEKKYWITYNSWEGCYMVHTQDGPVRFYKDENGLPFINLEDSDQNVAALLIQMGSEEAATALVQTGRQNYKGSTKKKVLQAKEARRTMGIIGNPSKNNFKGIVSNNMITNCPITTTAITNARSIFGPDLTSFRGKTVQRTSAPVVGDYVAVPKGVIERNKTVMLAADVFFVDGIAFLLRVSKNIKFITAEHVASCTAKSLTKHMDRVIQVYTRACFSVRIILMDGEFEKVKNELPLVVSNTTAVKEHVSDAEHSIRTLKEWMQGIVGTLPFKFIPRRLKMEFIYFVVLWLNAFPAKSGVSAT